ncbi:hypothetical protein MTR67_002981 [Solanum verrucosum]|uniref:Uncharacterized protein n=1 Tax=Solanum verrucosum TaxID=315347 RepID=A0AAF0PVX5_SOLVR|nr:hypothetical protein MTR67_002981 [Solanum verrucosum]
MDLWFVLQVRGS